MNIIRERGPCLLSQHLLQSSAAGLGFLLVDLQSWLPPEHERQQPRGQKSLNRARPLDALGWTKKVRSSTSASLPIRGMGTSY